MTDVCVAIVFVVGSVMGHFLYGVWSNNRRDRKLQREMAQMFLDGQLNKDDLRRMSEL